MIKISKQSFQENLTQLKEIGRMLFPKGKSEWRIFGGFALFYLSYSIVIGLYTSLTDNMDIRSEIYFEYDTSLFIHTGSTTYTAHPMLCYFMAPFFFLSDLLALLFDSYKAKSLFFVILCCLLIPASVVYVYRYLRTIIRLNGLALYIPVFFYAFTSTNLILCFTAESFPISVFLLTFTVYFYAHALKNGSCCKKYANLYKTIIDIKESKFKCFQVVQHFL
jgi:hypothetical protein